MKTALIIGYRLMGSQLLEILLEAQTMIKLLLLKEIQGKTRIN
jgi:hypothetical protein